jgi:hypothetical protein
LQKDSHVLPESSQLSKFSTRGGSFSTTAKFTLMQKEKDLLMYPGPGSYLGLDEIKQRNVVFGR